MSAESASTAAAAAVHHDEIPRVPGRYRTTRYGFAEDGHGANANSQGAAVVTTMVQISTPS
jgi:hypothetical protein